MGKKCGLLRCSGGQAIEEFRFMNSNDSRVWRVSGRIQHRPTQSLIVFVATVAVVTLASCHSSKLNAEQRDQMAKLLDEKVRDLESLRMDDAWIEEYDGNDAAVVRDYSNRLVRLMEIPNEVFRKLYGMLLNRELGDGEAFSDISKSLPKEFSHLEELRQSLVYNHRIKRLIQIGGSYEKFDLVRIREHMDHDIDEVSRALHEVRMSIGSQ